MSPDVTCEGSLNRFISSIVFAVVLTIGCGGGAPSKPNPDAGGTGANAGTRASCVGLAATCGPGGNVDCCAANLITGGTFNRDNDASPATVSDFRLDNYEITVGRFRKFVAAYSQTMTAAGAGKNPNNSSDPGWDSAWNASRLPASALELMLAVGNANPAIFGNTWTDSAGGNENRPMNDISWYEAYAFCIWDGGRLPTEAEWSYAATGGNEQRAYPWGATAPDCTYANFGGTNFPTTACVSSLTGSTNRVGSESPKGDGKYGQSDLAGNVYEWVEDWYGNYPNPCNNCFNSNSTAAGDERVIRGGSFDVIASDLLSSSRVNESSRGVERPSNRTYRTGARCSRTP